MASKHNPSPYLSDSTGLVALAQVPPRISLNSPLLASEISLPPHPLIHCWIYTSPSSPDSANALEAARRNLVRKYESVAVTRAILPRVHIAQDSQLSALYTFAISSADNSLLPDMPIAEGNAEGLICSESYHFSPDGLYPCSAACSMQLLPCASCLSMQLEDPSVSSWGSACLLPRIPLRRPFTEFIHAIRDRLIEDIVHSSIDTGLGTDGRTAVRFKQGILLDPPHATSAEWGLGWNNTAHQRSPVYCELQLHLYSTSIVVHPILRSSHMLRLPIATPSPIAAGTPITLLPHGIPAYYLNTYTGPVGSLTTEFDVALAGLGAGGWKLASSSRPHPATATHGPRSPPNTPTYIIAWLAVQNRHGEDKGMPIIWPSGLCAVPTSTFPHPRPPLSFLPLVPAQLLASPPAPAARVPAQTSTSNVLAPSFTLGEQPAASPIASSARGSISGPSDQGPSLPQSTSTMSMAAPRPLRPSISRSHTSDSLRAFRSLTIQHKPARTAALEVSHYVDAVARDREKERERLKREREGGSMSRSGIGTIKTLEKTPTMKSASSSPRKMQVDTPTGKQRDLTMGSPNTPTPDKYIPPLISQSTAPSKPGPVELAFPTGGILSTTTEVAKLDTPIPAEPAKEEIAQHVDSQTAETATSSSSHSFDAFSGFDTNWNQSNNDFMSLDGYDMSMGFSMGINDGGDGGDAFNMDDGFGVFTDDDFNFFDSPATTTKATTAVFASGLTSAPGHALPGQLNALSTDGIQTSGPGPPSLATQAQPIPWLKGEGMTPASFGALTPAVALPPDLLPSTPTQTPPSHSAPVTPSVQLADQLQSVHIRRSSVSSSVSSSFDPIPFAQSHKTADGKYARGKFAMATPPPDEELVSIKASSRSSASGWHMSYRTATDPRIGIVRRLAGAKRKRLSTAQDEREDKRTTLWMREDEEWAGESVPEEPESDADAGLSGSDLDDDDAMNEDRSRSVSRAHTPPPSYLPLGPTLIQTQFQHRYLLPLCAPLRPPGTDPEVAIGIAAPLMSAPTPVSPAANLGTPSERSKALEGAAQILIKEVVENSVWGESWQAALIAAQGSLKANGEIWMSDVYAASKLLGSVEGVVSPQTVGNTFVTDDMRELSSPKFTVAKSDGFIQVLPPALRFWEKLGLHPRAGSKHLTGYAFFEGSDDETEARIIDWLGKLSAVYKVKNYGTHTLGQSASCTRDGLVPVTFDPAFRKTLVSFVASLSELDAPMVFYIVTPAKMMNLASSSLRHIFSAVKKVKKTYPDAPILIHLIPEPLILGALHDPSLNHGGLEAVADAVYNRALIPTDRTMSRPLLPAGEKASALFSEPAFALTGPSRRKVKFSLEAHPSTLDVLDRHYMLHVGYRTSECGKWLFASCIDQRGDAHDMRAWLIPEDDPDQFVINNVWDFAMGMAKKAHVEWRIILSRLGRIPTNELHAWTVRLGAASVENQHLPPMQVQLLAAEFADHWHFLVSKDAPSHRRPATPNRSPKHSSGVVFADVSSTFYMLQHRIPRMTSSSTGCTAEPPFVPDTEEDKPLEELQIRSLHSTTLIMVPAGTDHTSISMLHLNLLHSMHSVHAAHTIADKDTLNEVTRNFHELAILTRHRWKLNVDRILPFHLATLEVISSALSRSDTVTD